MRKAARKALGRGRDMYEPSAHIGLAYDMFAPIVEEDAKVPDDDRERWFDALENVSTTAAYSQAFDRWKKGLESVGARVIEICTQSRLLIGHGNPSPTEVGLTVSHTWGTPLLPGSSLKGILHHALVAKYGPATPSGLEKAGRHSLPHPRDPEHPEADRAGFQEAVWNRDGKRIRHGPGDVIRWIFGAPDADDDVEARRWLRPDEDEGGPQRYIGAARGQIRFLDAWMLPDKGAARNPFARDVLTVHQRGYYGQGGAGDDRPSPNDHDSPNPVGFLSVRRDVHFLLAITGGDEAGREFVLDELLEALAVHGIGGKTMVGYGQVEAAPDANARTLKAAPRSELLDHLEALLARERDDEIPTENPDGPSWKDLWTHVLSELFPGLMGKGEAERMAAVEQLKRSRLAKHRKLRDEVARYRDKLETGQK